MKKLLVSLMMVTLMLGVTPVFAEHTFPAPYDGWYEKGGDYHKFLKGEDMGNNGWKFVPPWITNPPTGGGAGGDATVTNNNKNKNINDVDINNKNKNINDIDINNKNVLKNDIDNKNVNKIKNKNEQSQGQAQGQAQQQKQKQNQSQGQGQSQSSSNTNVVAPIDMQSQSMNNGQTIAPSQNVSFTSPDKVAIGGAPNVAIGGELNFISPNERDVQTLLPKFGCGNIKLLLATDCIVDVLWQSNDVKFKNLYKEVLKGLRSDAVIKATGVRYQIREAASTKTWTTGGSVGGNTVGEVGNTISGASGGIVPQVGRSKSSNLYTIIFVQVQEFKK